MCERVDHPNEPFLYVTVRSTRYIIVAARAKCLGRKIVSMTFACRGHSVWGGGRLRFLLLRAPAPALIWSDFHAGPGHADFGDVLVIEKLLQDRCDELIQQHFSSLSNSLTMKLI